MTAPATKALRASLDAFGRAWGREAHVLVGRPGLVFPQVHGRVQWESPPVDSDLLARERMRRAGAGRPWLHAHDPIRESGALVRTCVGHTARVARCAFAPDSTWAVSASDDGTLKVWDARSGALLATMVGNEGSPGWVWGCSVSPDGATLASAGHDGTVRLWDPTTGAERLRIEAHDGSALTCSFSPDGTRLASAGAGGVRIWDVASGGLLGSLDLEDPRGVVAALTFAPDGRSVLVGIGTSLITWELATGHRSVHAGARAPLDRCAVDPTGARAVTTGIRELRLWDLRSGATRLLAERSASDCTWTPDGDGVLTGGAALSVWDPDADAEVQHLVGHEGEVEACAASPDGTLAVTGGADGTVRFWDLQRRYVDVWDAADLGFPTVLSQPDARWRLCRAAGPVVVDPPGEPGWALSAWHRCAMSEDGSIAVSRGDAGYVVWDPVTGEEQGRITTASDVGVAAVAPDGTWLLGTTAGRLEVWDLRSLRSLGAFVAGTDPVSGEHVSHFGAAITDCSISPDCRWVASADAGGMLDLWEPASGSRLERGYGEVRGHCCAAGPDGSFLVAGGDDGELVVADVASTSLLRMAAHTGRITDCAVTPDGAMAVTAGADRAVRVWDRTDGSLLLEGFLPRAGELVLHPWKPWVFCATALGPMFVELEGLWYGPICVTADATGRVRCPACGKEQTVTTDDLGQLRACGGAGCTLSLRIAPQRRAEPAWPLTDTTDDDVRRTYYDDW